MSTTSFHTFPNLPVELRLQIWEEAFDTPQLRQQGIHYVDIYTQHERPLSPALVAFHPGYENDTFGSACLMNRGLWKACRESREVITKKSKKSKSPAKTPMQVSRTDGRPDGYCRVNGWKDIFCIRTSRCNVGQYVSTVMQMRIQGIDSKGWEFPVKNIAFEFDPTWLIDIPATDTDMTDEDSPRGLFLCFLQARQTPNIWLIDRETAWSSGECADCAVSTPLFVDGTDYYVEGRHDALCLEHDVDERSRALTTFLEKLEDIILEGKFRRWGLSSHVDSRSFANDYGITTVVEDVRFLFCRSREVALCQRCPDHEHGYNRDGDGDEWDTVGSMSSERW
ncbi:hypothetical protein NXS19_012991 [Fusarium pseudograminearum]|nr:hypothetical protein NXS19_012991 [Fusarium pseudograminearum]